MLLSASEFAFLFSCVTWSVLVLVFARRTPIRRRARVPRVKLYARMSINTVMSGTLALAVALLNGIPVFRTAALNTRNILLAAALLALGLIYDRVEWRLSSPQTKLRAWDLLPQNRRERMCWVLGTVSAGVCEEIFFRGVLFGILVKIIDGPLYAAGLTALIFGIDHLPYGRAAAIGAFLHSLGLQWLVQFSGTLYYAMLVHYLYDAIIGLFFGARPPAAAPQETLTNQTELTASSQ